MLFLRRLLWRGFVLNLLLLLVTTFLVITFNLYEEWVELRSRFLPEMAPDQSVQFVPECDCRRRWFYGPPSQTPNAEDSSFILK